MPNPYESLDSPAFAFLLLDARYGKPLKSRAHGGGFEPREPLFYPPETVHLRCKADGFEWWAHKNGANPEKSFYLEHSQEITATCPKCHHQGKAPRPRWPPGRA